MTKQWPLAPNSREWQITRANVSRRVTFFSKMAFGECRRVWRVRATRLGKCRLVWRVRATLHGECRWDRRVWRVRHISEKGHFGEYSNSPKMANFWRVLEFDKFAVEWPLLSHDPLKGCEIFFKGRQNLCIPYYIRQVLFVVCTCCRVAKLLILFFFSLFVSHKARKV